MTRRSPHSQQAQNGRQPRAATGGPPALRRAEGWTDRPQQDGTDAADRPEEPLDDALDSDAWVAWDALDVFDTEPDPQPGDFAIEPEWDDPEASPYAGW